MKPNFCLTSPVQLGAYTLPNPIVIASNTRLQAYNHAPQAEAITYYGGLAECGLIISEPTLIAPFDNLSHYPGIFTREQLRSWRNVTETVVEHIMDLISFNKISELLI